jgi:serine/threonine-protein kinase RsbW
MRLKVPDGSFIEPMHLMPNTPAQPDIHLVFPATEISVRRALLSLRASLKALAVDDLTIGMVEIILAEVANNIFEHAYPLNVNGTVTLACTKAEQGLRFEVCDQGRTLPGGEIPSKKEHDLEADRNQLPEGGFGWGLIRDMTTMLMYKRDRGRNILRFRVAFASI